MNKTAWPWLLPEPLVLASGSETRAKLLRAAGITPDIIKPAVDERSLDGPVRALGFSAADRALILARAKTSDVAARNRQRVVIGADQTLDAAGHPGIKAGDNQEARTFLKLLSGRTHQLHSAWCVAIDGTILCEGVTTATLHMRVLTDDFITSYIEAAGECVLQSVGCYQIEALGQQMFEKIEGDHSTILGLPMMPVLDFFRRRGMVAG